MRASGHGEWVAGCNNENQPRQTDDVSDLLQTEVMRIGWSDDDVNETLEVHDSTTWIATGGRVQQRNQPKQTDDVSDLFETEAVRIGWNIVGRVERRGGKEIPEKDDDGYQREVKKDKNI